MLVILASWICTINYCLKYEKSVVMMAKDELRHSLEILISHHLLCLFSCLMMLCIILRENWLMSGYTSSGLLFNISALKSKIQSSIWSYMCLCTKTASSIKSLTIDSIQGSPLWWGFLGLFIYFWNEVIPFFEIPNVPWTFVKINKLYFLKNPLEGQVTASLSHGSAGLQQKKGTLSRRSCRTSPICSEWQ